MCFRDPNAQWVPVPCPSCGSTSSRPERTVNGFELERCNHCHLVFANPQYAIGALHDFYVERGAVDLLDLYNRHTTVAVVEDYQTISGATNRWGTSTSSLRRR